MIVPHEVRDRGLNVATGVLSPKKLLFGRPLAFFFSSLDIYLEIFLLVSTESRR
jgi:hypothetical protein